MIFERLIIGAFFVGCLLGSSGGAAHAQIDYTLQNQFTPYQAAPVQMPAPPVEIPQTTIMPLDGNRSDSFTIMSHRAGDPAIVVNDQDGSTSVWGTSQ